MVDTVILGADEPVGREYLKGLIASGKRAVTGITVSSPKALTPELLSSLPHLKAIGLRKGTFDSAPEGVSVILGESCEMKLVEKLHPTECALCVFGIRSARIYSQLAKTRSAILLGDTATVLLDEVDPEDLAGVRSLDLRMKIARLLAPWCEKGDVIELVYKPDEQVLNTPPQKLFSLTGKELAKDGLEPTGRAEEALFIRGFLDILSASKLSGLPIDRFAAVTGNPDIHPAIMRKADGSLVTVDHQNQVVPVEEELVGSYAAPDSERYPLLDFLKGQVSRFGRRAELAILASSEAALSATAEGRIDLSSVETIVRKAVSTCCRNTKTPASEKEAQLVFSSVYEDASQQAEKAFNARKNNNTSADARRSRQLNRKKALRDRAAEVERQERKRASRWRNDPEKSELWNEHVKRKETRKRLERENERREKARIENGRKKAAQTPSFPVAIVDDERADRERHLRERENRPKKSSYGSRDSGYKGSGYKGEKKSDGYRKSDNQRGSAGRSGGKYRSDDRNRDSYRGQRRSGGKSIGKTYRTSNRNTSAKSREWSYPIGDNPQRNRSDSRFQNREERGQDNRSGKRSYPSGNSRQNRGYRNGGKSGSKPYGGKSYSERSRASGRKGNRSRYGYSGRQGGSS